MDMRDLGRTGLTVTPIGLGCWQLQQGKGVTGKMWSVLDQETMDAIVSAALRGGISWYDTAQVYGNGASERALAAGLRHAGVEPGSVVVIDDEHSGRLKLSGGAYDTRVAGIVLDLRDPADRIAS
jgi:aryl-alcohol dehydrogenase-like predicted oxidoreductase